MSTHPQPAADQIWEDAGPRSEGSFLRVVEATATRAVLERVAWDADDRTTVPLPGYRRTNVCLGRMRPTSSGHRFVTSLEKR
ncbi:hypothetical protein ACIQXD_29485 [Streptomyces uncialis]|uniref:hypothetical protein n=1 Tax=Streptomyces uncialis TaxID=1048205 RepID=UPI00380D5554